MIAWLLTNTLTAACLAGLVYLVIRFGKPAPAVRHALWLIVLLKLVSPVEFFWSIPLPVQSPETSEDVPVVCLPESPAPVYGLISEEVFEVEMTATGLTEIPDECSPAPATLIDLAPTECPQPIATLCTPTVMTLKERWLWWLFGIWLIGAVIMAMRLFRETWAFNRFTKQAKKANDDLVSEVAIVANRMNVRTPVVRMLTGLTSPLMWCFGRPVLLWPAELNQQMSPEGRRAVIAHELAHLRRRDHWVRWLEMLAAVVHWWNPIFRWTRRRLRADAELACDQWAAMQTDRRTYAEALLTVCAFQPRRRPATAVGVFGEGKRDMQERLTMIMQPTKPSRLAFAAKLCVALFGIAAVPAWTLGQAPAPVKPEKTKPVDVIVTDTTTADDFTTVEFFTFMEQDAETQLIEAKIKELTAQLEKLKASKAKQGEKTKPAVPTDKITEKMNAVLQQAKDAEQAAKNQSLKALLDLQKTFKEEGATETLKEIEKKLEQLQLLNPKIQIKDATSKDVLIKPLLINKTGQSATVTIDSTAVPAEKLNIKVIGADGKEIKDVKVIVNAPGQPMKPVVKPLPPAAPVPPLPPGAAIIPPLPPVGVPGMAIAVPPATNARIAIVNSKPAPASNTVTLSRATYKLPKEQITALTNLLNNVKANVMEIKVDGDNLTVTTSPEAQQVIQGLVQLLTGQKVTLMNISADAVWLTDHVLRTTAAPVEWTQPQGTIKEFFERKITTSPSVQSMQPTKVNEPSKPTKTIEVDFSKPNSTNRPALEGNQSTKPSTPSVQK